MKILFVLENTIDNLEGGTEVSSFHLARLLRQKRIEVEEWVPYKTRKPTFWYTGIIFQLYIFLVLSWKLVKSRVNVIHVQGKYLIPPVVMMGKLLRIPVVATIRDYVVVTPTGWPANLAGRPEMKLSEYRRRYQSKMIFLVRGFLVSWWLRWWLKRADAVVAVSKYVQQILGHIGVRAAAIHNVFDTSLLEVSHTSKTLNTVLFVGKPSYGKGYDLFKTLSRREEFKDYRFMTVGDGKKLPYLQALEEMQRALVVVVPSRWQEPFGRVALEAIMMGTPVVAARRGGLAEIVEDGVTGVLAEPTLNSLAAAVRQAIAGNRELRENIVKKRRGLIRKFRDVPVEKHLKIYNSLR